VQQDKKLLPFKIVEGKGNKPIIQVNFKGEARSFTPEGDNLRRSAL